MHSNPPVAAPLPDSHMIASAPLSLLLIGTGITVLLLMHSRKLAKWSAKHRLTSMLKRTLDIVTAITAILLLLPALVACAIVVKVTSRGPILARHLCTDHNGLPFYGFRFRTKHLGSTSNDPSFTRIGRILQKFGLDGLPLLLNMLRGDAPIAVQPIARPRPAPAAVEQRSRR